MNPYLRRLSRRDREEIGRLQAAYLEINQGEKTRGWEKVKEYASEIFESLVLGI